MQKILPSQTFDGRTLYCLNNCLGGGGEWQLLTMATFAFLFHTENLISNIMLGSSQLHTSVSSKHLHTALLSKLCNRE